MPQVPPEPIQPPADQDVEPPALSILDKTVQGGAPVLGTGHPLVDVLSRLRPASGSDVAAELGELILGLLRTIASAVKHRSTDDRAGSAVIADHPLEA